MKYSLLILCALLLSACNKKEDAKAPGVVDIQGQWIGTGTDDSIGFYNISVNIISQTGGQAFGTYDTSSQLVNTHGDIRLDLIAGGGNNITGVTMTRTTWGPASCAGTATASHSSFITSKAGEAFYTIVDCKGTNNGGFNLHRP